MLDTARVIRKGVFAVNPSNLKYVTSLLYSVHNKSVFMAFLSLPRQIQGQSKPVHTTSEICINCILHLPPTGRMTVNAEMETTGITDVMPYCSQCSSRQLIRKGKV